MSGFKCLFLDPLNCSSGRFFKSTINNQSYMALEIIKSEINQDLLTEEVQIEFEMQDCSSLRCISQWLPDVNIDYILYNYVEGETLSSTIKKKSLSEENILFWIADILCALKTLHSKVLLGRCFSTESIKVQKKDNNLVLFDFGFFPQLLKPNKRAIAAPELVLKQEYSYKLDVWLLGVIAFEMLTQTPLTLIKNDKINDYINFLKVYQQQSNGIKIPKEFNDKYSKELISLVEGMLLFDPNERITFEEIAQNQLFNQLQLSCISFYQNEFPQLLNQINEKISQYDQYKKQKIVKNLGIQQSIAMLPSNQELKNSVEQLQAQLENKSKLVSKESVSRNNILFSYRLMLPVPIWGKLRIKMSQPVLHSVYSDNKVDQHPQLKFEISDSIYISLQQVRINSLNLFEIQPTSQFEYKDISDRLALDLYKLNFLKLFLNELPKFYIVFYYITKVKIIYLRELYRNLQYKGSQDYVTKQSKYLESQVQQRINQEVEMLQTKYYTKAINRTQILSQNQQFIPNIAEQTFEECKTQYRIVMLSLYRILLMELENNANLSDIQRNHYYLFTIKTLFCHLINRIFDPSLMGNHFQYLAQILKISNTANFECVELFLTKCTAMDVVQQMNQILKIYFS